MENARQKLGAPSIYIIGAQCTGKTTLVNSITEHLGKVYPGLPFAVIKELARAVLKSEDVNRDDITNGSDKGMKFQSFLLQAQLEEELGAQHEKFIISDRSGIDPIAYAKRYGQPHYAHSMLSSSAWATLGDKMRRGTVIICEPVPAWLFDDGIRLMPKDTPEWIGLHQTFIDLLQSSNIGFHILPATFGDLDTRVKFVLDKWRVSASLNCGAIST
jgi:predicted ATPase